MCPRSQQKFAAWPEKKGTMCSEPWNPNPRGPLWKIDFFTNTVFLTIHVIRYLGGLGVSRGMAWAIRRDSHELWQNLVLHGMGEIDFHVFFVNIGNSLHHQITPNWSSGLQIGPRIYFKARVPSQELSNNLIFRKDTPKTTYVPGN